MPHPRRKAHILPLALQVLTRGTVLLIIAQCSTSPARSAAPRSSRSRGCSVVRLLRRTSAPAQAHDGSGAQAHDEKKHGKKESPPITEL